MGAGWARLVTRRPWLFLVGVVVLLGIVALPFLHLQLGLPDAGTQSKSTTERRAYDLLATGFGPGFNGPLTVVVDATGKKHPEQIANAASKALGKFPNVATASAADLQRERRDRDHLRYPRDRALESGDQKPGRRDPQSGEARAGEVRIDVLVTGTTAVNIDISNKLSSALPVMLVLIVLLALLLLTLVFRSLLVPLKAVVGFLFTIGAALGLMVFVFQDGHLGNLIGIDTTSPIVSFLPVIMVALLFGLAMDYEVFLVSRIRESYVHEGEQHARSSRDSVAAPVS